MSHQPPARVVCFGELMLRLSPPGHELPLQSPSLEARYGGAEANVAASLAILGHHSVVVTALPDHAIGRAGAGELRRHGVDTSGVRYAEGRMGLYFLSHGAMQRPSEVIYDRAGSVFATTPADAYDWPQLLAGAQWLHLSGINLALNEHTAQAALAAVRAARSLGVQVSFDGNYRSKLWGTRAAQAPALLREIMSHADLIFGNDRDIALALGQAFPQAQAEERFRAAAAAAFEAWPQLRLLAATARSHNSVDDQALSGLLATRERVLTTAAHAMSGIVDRIGGGDAFAAGLLHGLLRGVPQQEALDFAVAAGCLKHSVPGDVNVLREADMQAFLQQDGFEVKR
ncbi:sugar kinase [Dyella solisilvae]|uniref:Sugar kinase n=1 Tax=Dyella solisilvae TaxID=1920168 RepID=A0A370K8C3_9GAMM|nr:sugar kinase [Dyella solisilvae]RDI98911.1 sugar kinase [Dyella solisilvae]